MLKIQDQPKKQPKKVTSKLSFIDSNTSFESSNQKKNYMRYTISSEPSSLQPKLQNKKMKFYRTSHSSFFNHLSHTKKVQMQQLSDSPFLKLINNNNNKKIGFKGNKTHSWNQLVYLTPQKRHKNSTQQLTQIKKQLYQAINIEQQKEKNETQKSPVKATLIEFLTGYDYENRRDGKNQNVQNKIKTMYNRRSSNIIRQKLKSYNKKTEYKQRLQAYKMIFQGYKLS